MFELRILVSLLKNDKVSSRTQHGRPSSSKDSTQEITHGKRRKVAPDNSIGYD